MTDTPANSVSASELDAFLGAPPPSPWRRRVIWGGTAIVLIALLFLLSRCFSAEGAPIYATSEARKGELTVTVSATGKLAPTNQVDVGSELSGLILKVMVDNNDRVTAGQPLAELDPARLDDTVTRSRATLGAQEATVAQARATLAEAEATLGRYREVNRLSDGKVPAKTEMDSAIAAVGRARANLAAAEANVVSARAQLSSDTTNRYRAIIRSPVNGVVLSRKVEPGQTVAASFNTPTLFTIAEDLTQMRLEVSIDEADVGQVKDGQRATFNVDAWPGRRFPATITRVDLGANASGSGASASSSSTASTTTVVAYTALLSVQNPDLVLRPGMTATADILVDERRDVLLVPNAALRFTPSAGSGPQQRGAVMSALTGPRLRGPQNSREGAIGAGSQRTIYVLDGGRAKPIEVTTGATDGRNTEVTSNDLKPGMQVITGTLAAAAR